MQAAELFEQQVKPAEVARLLRVSVKSVYQWRQLWQDGGREALASLGPSGSRCRLSPQCLQKPAAYLEQGPAAHGWVEDQVWAASRVATLIGRKFHVSYSVSGATRLMHRLGFSPQVPARRVAERDEGALPGRPTTYGGDLGGGKRARAACGATGSIRSAPGFSGCCLSGLESGVFAGQA
ncbi:transposase [Streptomyces sp. NPDC093094]|uniref:helix-turn-helix domain-containing protein n=1 Tax=Streptomyces sp. NPDC093094 TaxID=3366026 RepID=UPI003823C2A5